MSTGHNLPECNDALFVVCDRTHELHTCHPTGPWRSWVWTPPVARYRPSPLHLELWLSLHTKRQDPITAHIYCYYMMVQVTDKDADGVLDEIESAIFQAAASILAGQGFSYR